MRLIVLLESPCSPNPCQNSGSCSVCSNNPYYKCSCKSGYSGQKCESEISYLYKRRFIAFTIFESC